MSNILATATLGDDGEARELARCECSGMGVKADCTVGATGTDGRVRLEEELELEGTITKTLVQSIKMKSKNE